MMALSFLQHYLELLFLINIVIITYNLGQNFLEKVS